jgi:hypothetical protein
LLCGLAIQEHKHSILYRREFPQIKGLLGEFKRILGTRDGYNSQDKLWKLPDGREVEFGCIRYDTYRPQL